MLQLEMKTFKSFLDFFSRFWSIFKGPTFLMTFLKIDKKLREKILLTVSIGNNCSLWVTAHTAVGKQLGISQEEIERLINLDKSDFEYKEWLALKYARESGLIGGEEPKGDFLEEFEKHYTERERKYILKLIRVQGFANRLVNSIKRSPWRSDLATGPAVCNVIDKQQGNTNE